MGHANELADKVRRRLQAEHDEQAAAQQSVEQAMQARRDTAARLMKAAEPLQHGVVWPAMETLARQFDTLVQHLTLPGGFSAVLRRARTAEFPATARLSLGVAWSEESGRLWLSADQSFMPVLLPLDRTTQLQVDVADPDAQAIRAWVEERILAFVDACLEVERADVYRQSAHHLDPVCGMMVAAESGAFVIEREGRRYYFCSSTCRDRFVADPVPYIGGPAHSEGGDNRGVL